MNKEKKIKELEQTIIKICPTLSIEYCTGKPCTECIAEHLQYAGYRKINENDIVISKEEKQKLLKEMYEQGKFDALADLDKEGKVVLSREEYQKDFSNQFNKGYKNGCKETAREIFNQIIWYAIKRIGQTSGDSFYQISFDRLKDLAKQFGVEIGEEK